MTTTDDLRAAVRDPQASHPLLGATVTTDVAGSSPGREHTIAPARVHTSVPAARQVTSTSDIAATAIVTTAQRYGASMQSVLVAAAGIAVARAGRSSVLRACP